MPLRQRAGRKPRQTAPRSRHAEATAQGCRAHCTNRSAPGQVAAAAAPPFLHGKERLQHGKKSFGTESLPGASWESLRQYKHECKLCARQPGTGYQHFPGCRHGTAQGKQLKHSKSPCACRRGGERHGANVQTATGSLLCKQSRASQTPAKLLARVRSGGSEFPRLAVVIQSLCHSLPEGEITGHAAALRQTATTTTTTTNHPPPKKKATQKSLLWHFLIFFKEARSAVSKELRLYKREIKQEANKPGQGDY